MSKDNVDDTDEKLDDGVDSHLLHSFLEVTPPSVLLDIRQPEQKIPAHDNNDWLWFFFLFMAIIDYDHCNN